MASSRPNLVLSCTPKPASTRKMFMHDGKICIHDGWGAHLTELCTKYYDDASTSLDELMFGCFSCDAGDARGGGGTGKQAACVCVVLDFCSLPVSTCMPWNILDSPCHRMMRPVLHHCMSGLSAWFPQKVCMYDGRYAHMMEKYAYVIVGVHI